MGQTNSEQTLIDYLHGALSDAERVAFEDRLRDDSALRDRLGTQRQLQQRLRGVVSAEISSQDPPASMTFAAISSDVLKRQPRANALSRFASSLAAFAAIGVMLFALIYSLPDQADGPIEGSGATPTVVVTTVNALEPVAPITPTLTTTPTNNTSIPDDRPKTSIPTRESDSSIPPSPEPTPEANVPLQQVAQINSPPLVLVGSINYKNTAVDV